MVSPAKTERHCRRIHDLAARLGPVRIMEICGTHTVALFRTGVKSMLPKSLRLISGPGCPVCVTSQAYLDAACELAQRPEVSICTYGDMVRVPGSRTSLEQCRGQGADVRVVYSPRDALAYAADRPDRQVVFLAVGFETTTPPTAAACLEAQQRRLDNFFILPGHKRVMPAMEALLAGGDVPIDAFMCPGHVSVVIGPQAYEPIVTRHHKPCAVVGFEPEQMLRGLAALLAQLAEGRCTVENVYPVAVPPQGNPLARQLIERVFQPGPDTWRALGVIPDSGWALRSEYGQFDAFRRFEVSLGADVEPAGCRCGEVIQGKCDPPECGMFGRRCTPMNPVGPCMVSSEGACAAWFKYQRDAVAGGNP